MSAQDLLNRLESVRQRTADQWSARCPAHDDRSPSLSVRETAEGLVLLQCWAGCEVAEIVAAVGLELSCLFPEKSKGGRPLKRRRLLSAGQALECLAAESLLLAVVAKDVAQGKPLDQQTRQRVATAAGRIAALHLETSL
jgi:hypothetical protein